MANIGLSYNKMKFLNRTDVLYLHSYADRHCIHFKVSLPECMTGKGKHLNDITF